MRGADEATRSPQAMRGEDLEPLRAAGLSDTDLHDAVRVIRYSNSITRIADGLGTDPEPPPQPSGS